MKRDQITYHTGTRWGEDLERIGPIIEICFRNSWYAFWGCEVVCIMPHLGVENGQLHIHAKMTRNAYSQEP